MATLDEMKAAVPTFFNRLPPEARITAYKGHVIVTIPKPKSVTIHRFVPNKVRSEMAKVPVSVATVEEAKEVIDGAGAGVAA